MKGELVPGDLVVQILIDLFLGGPWLRRVVGHQREVVMELHVHKERLVEPGGALLQLWRYENIKVLKR